MNFWCSSRYVGVCCLLVVSLPPPPLPLQPSSMNVFRAEGLSPYLEYEFFVSAMNEFTMLDLPLTFDPLFGRVARIRTLQGGMLACVCVWGGGGGGGGGGVRLGN